MKFRDLAEICLATYGLCKALDAFQEIGERQTRRNEMKRAKRTRRKEKQRPYEKSITGRLQFKVSSTGEAEHVQRMLDSELYQYGEVSVAVACNIMHTQTPPTKSDYVYGWRSLSDVDVKQIIDGATISFPKPEFIGGNQNE